MNSNELRDYVRELNKQEAVEQELRRQKALNRIRELRRAMKEQQERQKETE